MEKKGKKQKNEGFRVKMDKIAGKNKKLQKKSKKKELNLITKWFEIL